MKECMIKTTDEIICEFSERIMKTRITRYRPKNTAISILEDELRSMVTRIELELIHEPQQVNFELKTNFREEPVVKF